MGNIKYSVSLSKDKEGKPILRTIDRGLYEILNALPHKSTGSKHEIAGFKLSYFDFIAIGFGLSMSPILPIRAYCYFILGNARLLLQCFGRRLYPHSLSGVWKHLGLDT